MSINATPITCVVLDPCIALGLCFEDHIDATVLETIQHLRVLPGIVNHSWHSEVAEALLQAEKRRKINTLDRRKFFSLINALQLEIEPTSSLNLCEDYFEFALEHNIHIQDAERIFIALKRNGILATNKSEVIKVAKKIGANIIEFH